MKKLIAVILALLMCLSLFACGETAKEPEKTEAPASEAAPAEETTPAAEPEAAAEPAAEPAETDAAGYPGYPLDDSIDYYARDKYTLCYAMPAETAMHDSFLDAFQRLADKYNVEIISSNANSDAEAYITNIEIMATKGVDGFFIDCPNAVCGRCKELMDDLEIPYISFLSPLYDEDRHMSCPGVVQDSRGGGAVEAQWFYENYTKFFGDIDPSEIKMVSLTSSSYAEFSNRSAGAVDKFKEYFPNNEVQEVDMTGKGVDATGAYDMVTPVITTQPEVKYWYIACGVDTWGQGVARAVEGANMEDICLVTSLGGGDLIAAWNAGYEGCWAASATYSTLDLCAPAISGLVALIDGRATIDTLWRELAIPGDNYGDAYGIWYVGMEAITIEDYSSFDARAAAKYGIPE